MTSSSQLPSAAQSVFISHVGTDEAWADWIATRLRAAGFIVSTPREAVPTGTNIVSELGEIVAGAGQVVVLLSEQSNASRWVQAEISLALAAGKRVIPIRVEAGASVPSDLSRLLYLDIAELAPDVAANRVVAALQGARSDTPLVDNLPTADITRWIDRRDELADIDAAFAAAQERTTPPMVVVVGQPGMGKTTLARQYVEGHRDAFASIRWVSGPQATSRIGVEDLGESTGGTQSLQLLVIDDVDDYHAIASLLPTDGRTAVLLTSRNASWGPPFTVIRLGTLELAASLDLLRRLVPEVQPDEAMRIAEAAGGLPLALGIMASLVRDQSVETVLDELAALRTTLAAAETEPHGFYYLDTDDPRAISEFERAFVEAVSTAGSIDFQPPEHGSWRRRWSQRVTGERLETLLDKAERAAEVAALTRPEGRANRDNAEAIARLLEASSAIPNMVVASGSVLLIKQTDQFGSRVFSKTLTATELRRFEENQHLLSQPADALAFLRVLSAGPNRELSD